MYYIKARPNESGNYGNPMGQPFSGSAVLPDDLLTPYIEARGFVNITIENNTVISLETNQEALDAYLAEYPDPEEEPTPESDVTDSEMAAAILEGVNDV